MDESALHAPYERIQQENREPFRRSCARLLRIQLHQDSPDGTRTPAMAAGVTDRLWEVSDLVALIEAEERGLERAA